MFINMAPLGVSSAALPLELLVLPSGSEGVWGGAGVLWVHQEYARFCKAWRQAHLNRTRFKGVQPVPAGQIAKCVVEVVLVSCIQRLELFVIHPY